jgi:hypothetical protein
MRNRTLLGMAIVVAGVAFFALGVRPSGSSTKAEFTDTACLDCHTDEALLRELAWEPEIEEPEESLSSGPG